MVAMSLLFWGAAARSSVEVDGTRYHYLDDDQMISMRYARNLADGLGPVWNDGERVEGYTNFGWMVVMAAVHAAGAGDATASAWVRGINWLLAGAVLLVAARLLRLLGARDVGAFAALVTMAVSTDLLFWAINGFETTLLTAVFLWSLARALEEAPGAGVRWTTYLLAGLLPVIRADAIDLTAVVVLTGIVAGGPKASWRAAVALGPLVAHEAFRVSYYGDWLPNTFYLKVAGRQGLWWSGAGYVKGFLLTYAAALILAMAGALIGRDRRARWLALAPLAGFARVLVTGPDIFDGFRFLAPYVPLTLVLGAAAIEPLAGAAPATRRTLAVLLGIVTIASAGVDGRTRFAALVSPNGLPDQGTVVGVLVARHTAPDASLAVLAAGATSYFSRRTSIDLLGKSDRHVARLPPRPLGPTGHNRYDIEYSLGRRPDVVSIFAPHVYVEQAARAAADPAYEPEREGYGAALVRSHAFTRHYLAQPVPLPYLLRHSALYVRADSPEAGRLASWREPRIGGR
jgi:hypothetical protein